MVISSPGLMPDNAAMKCGARNLALGWQEWLRKNPKSSSVGLSHLFFPSWMLRWFALVHGTIFLPNTNKTASFLNDLLLKMPSPQLAVSLMRKSFFMFKTSKKQS